MSDGLKAPSAESGAVAIASGTGFVGLLNLLPAEYHHMADGLEYFAPALSVGTGFVWRWARIKVTKAVLDRDLSNAIKRAAAIRDAILANPNSSDEHRDNAKGAVENLERLQFDALNDDYARVKAHLTSNL